MRLLLTVFFCFVNIFCYGQKIVQFSIDWEQKFEPTLNRNIWSGENISLNNKMIPVYNKQWRKDDIGSIVNVSFSNIVEKKINKADLDLSNLPSSFNPTLKLVKEINIEFYSIKANPIYINEKEEIIQIQSFQVSYELKSIEKSTTNFKISKQNIVTNSVLSNGTWYKFAIDKTGVYKLDRSFLQSLGIDVSSLNPKNIRIYGNGGAMLPELLSTDRKEDLVENAIYISDQNDGSLDVEDYILFYAQGPVSWSTETRDRITHNQNIYSDYSYYFINVDSGVEGKRIANNSNITNNTTIGVNTFTDYKVHEKDLYNYIKTGRKWFGEEFTDVNEQNFVFDFPNIETSQLVLVKGVFSAHSISTTSNYKVNYNNSNIISLNVSSSSSLAFLDNTSSAFVTPTSDQIELNVLWNNNGDNSTSAYMDYLEVIADRKLIGTGEQFGFLNFESNTDGEILEYELTNKDEIDFVWNVTDINTPININNTSSDNSFFKFKELTDGSLNKYHVVKSSDAYVPIKLDESLVENQNLHGMKDVQYIIVTKEEFIEEANRIRDYHKNNTTISEENGSYINVEVVSIDQIYNEFGSGSPDITAIRDFAKFLYDNSSSEDTRLKYLCLFGDASFDYKGITYSDDTQIVPTYQSTTSNNLSGSYSSDDYYGFLDDTDDDTEDGELDTQGKLDIVTGRIPVGTVTEANEYVDKLLNYYSDNTQGDWKNKITLLGDDGQGKNDQDLISHLEESSLLIEQNNPDFNILKLYSDAFIEEITSGGGSYPEINKRFHDAFNNGSLVINYFGHGNNYNLGEETFLDIATIRSFRNINNLPLFITITCDFSRFDDPTITSGGEELMNNAYGGVVAMMTTTREIYIPQARVINNALANYLYSFDGVKRTAAESLKDVKNNVTIENKFFVYYLGDPAMHLSHPSKGVEISKIEKYIQNSVSDEIDLEEVTELNALSKVKVSGNIKDNDVVLNDFDGTLFVTLYDKEIDRKTLLNEGAGTVVEFKSLENKVFVGQASVVKGEFSFDFVLSKDVSVLPEDAKFSFYAVSNSNERIGSDFSYKVGGLDEDVIEDTTAPIIELYMEDETFIAGGNTSSTPTLLAKINDENGINTSLNSIGHNITVVVDGDFVNPIVLNDYYTTEKDDFTNGIVSYEFSELSEGNHTITFKAWDTHNNSSTQTLSFNVQENTNFELSRVLNYPNPFIDYTEFWFKNNRQGDPLDVLIQIYTLSGKLVKTIKAFSDNTNDVFREATWDGKDDFGNKLGKGVYVYKLTVKENITGQSNQKIEKLVIL